MATRIAFGGLSIRIPGAYSLVDDTALTPTTLGAINRIGIIGSSEGGLANAQVMRFTSTATAKKYLVGGPLLTGLNLMYAPSPDSNGAYEVLACRADTDAVQASRDAAPDNPDDNGLLNLGGTQVLKVKARNYGEYTNNILMNITDPLATILNPVTDARKVDIWLGTSTDPPETNGAALGRVFQLERTDAVVEGFGPATSWTIQVTATRLTTTGVSTVPAGSMTELDLDLTNPLYDTVFKIIDHVKTVWNGVYNVAINGDVFTSKNLKAVDIDDTVGVETKPVNATSTPFQAASTRTLTSYIPSVRDWINNNSNLISAEIITNPQPAAPSTSPLKLVSGINLTQGSNGTGSTFDKWETCINAFEGQDVQLMVIMTDDLNIQLALKKHIQYMSTQGRNERRGFYGHPLGYSVSDVVNRCIELSDDRSCVATPGIAFQNDESGNPDIVSSVYLAAMYCGMAAGLPPQVPLTHKQLSIIALEKNFLESEVLELLDGGAAPAEFFRARNLYRIIQGQTTWLKDDNTLRKEISVGRISDFISINMRVTLESRFVGAAAELGTAEDIRVEATALLRQMAKAKIITAFGDVRVRIEDTIAYVEYQVAPTSPINFILITTRFVPSNLTA